jgi:hypothetical protein
VHIFAEALRGTGEGHRPMDGAPGATMTNATVSGVAAAPPRNTMTNATVANVAASSQGRKMTLTYTGGEKIVIVPADALVFATEAGSRDLLVPGAHVVVYAASQSDGTLASERISVGKNGYVPQM